MTRRRSSERLVIFLALTASFPPAALGALWWARAAPLDEQARFVTALLLVIPAWIGCVCGVSSMRRPTAGLVACATLSAAFWCGLHL